MKSLLGEIPLRGVEDGFPFTVSEANDFTRGQRPRILPRQYRDFTVAKPIRQMVEYYGVIQVAERKLTELSMDFAVSILNLCDRIKGHYSLVNQLERSATSIGANIREANYAHSRADFISKLQIALKECYETEYWLELLLKAQLSAADDVAPLLHDCGSIRRILVSSVNTAKRNQSADL